MYGQTVSRLRRYCGPYAEQVCELTGISKSQIAEMIFQAGMDFLQREGIEHYKTCKAFWLDFSYYWYSRDAEFIAECHLQEHVPDYWQFHQDKLKDYTLDQAVLRKVKEQLKAESYE